jgi:bifunctional UDP-N-acetylglucosamine pyrophosphorylase/glucosamine-1-phosphate N-acetyltransferase
MMKFFKKIFYLIKYLSWIDPNTKIGKNCKIGPFAHIRHGVVLGDNVSIGNFVEIKNSIIGKGTKINHLSYIGDAEIGENVNIGAGTITCNYDGKKKNKTIIEDNAFIGTNNSLVAPVKIGHGAYTAAGSVITENVPPYALAIGRAKQINKLNWVIKNQSKKD